MFDRDLKVPLQAIVVFQFGQDLLANLQITVIFEIRLKTFQLPEKDETAAVQFSA